MKQVKILFLLLAVLLAGASCGSDDDDKVSYKNADLEGLWVANGAGSGIGGVEDQIATAIGNSMNDLFDGSVTMINGKYRAYYFDGGGNGIKGVAASITASLEEDGRTNITYNVNKDILVMNDGLEAEFVQIQLSESKNSMEFVFDLTKIYQNKEFM